MSVDKSSEPHNHVAVNGSNICIYCGDVTMALGEDME